MLEEGKGAFFERPRKGALNLLNAHSAMLTSQQLCLVRALCSPSQPAEPAELSLNNLGPTHHRRCHSHYQVV
jgi:hypothetical protein